MKHMAQHSAATATSACLERDLISKLLSKHSNEHLTPELTGREELYQAFNLANERQADSAPVE
jgi:hypothetical protein